jgi:hypothetical protein
MTTRGEINSNFYQIVNVDANGAPTSVKTEYLPNIANAVHADFADVANSVAASNIVGTVANATHALISNSANTVAGANVTGYVPNAAHATVSDTANVANLVAVANVSGIGNIATINLDGSASNVLYGNGVFAPASGGNSVTANYANFAGEAFSVTGSNVTGIVGNATHANFADVANSVAGSNVIGIVANATHAISSDSSNSVAGANVTGTVSLATHADFSDVANSVSGSNVTGQVANALVSGTVYSAAQPNITSVGTLVDLSVTGNIQSFADISGAYIYGNGAFLTGVGNLSAARGYWGSFFSNVNQTIASTTTAYPITLNNSDPDSYGVYISSNSHINFQFAGTYNIQFSVQLLNSDASAQEAHIWIRKNGVDVADSRGTIAVADKQGSINGQTIGAWNYILDLASTDYIEFVWSAESTTVSLENLPAGTTPTTPSAPSMIVTAQQVTNVQPVELQGAMTGNITGNGFSLLNIASISSLDGITGNTFTGNGAPLTNLTGANVVGNVSQAVHSYFSDVANSVSGSNVSGPVAFATTANSVAGANVSGDVSGANHANISDVANVAYSVSGANVSGDVAGSNHANIADVANLVAGSNVSGPVAFATTANSVAVANVVGIGNIATVNLTGSSSNVLYGNGVFAPATGGGGGDANYANFAGNVVNSAQPNITSVGNLTSLYVEGNIQANTAVYVGYTANLTGLTNPTIVAKASGATYVQSAVVNGSANGSADMVTYGDNGSDSGAWADMGFTGSSFDDPAYTITGINDGYFFVQGDDSSAYGGNLVVATGPQGSTKDIVFATGGFLTTNEKMRFIHAESQFYIQPNTAATDNTTGALRVGGGVGIAGDVYAGNAISANFFLGDGGLLSNITFSGNAVSANYANFAGQVVDNTQSNITSVGTLTSLNVSGNVTASRLISNVATGTAPFVVTSNTVVANLNVANATAATQITYAGGTLPSATYYLPLVQGTGYRAAYIDNVSGGLTYDEVNQTVISPEFEGKLVDSPGSTSYVNVGPSSINSRISGTDRLVVNTIGANITGNLNASTSINAPRFVSNVATGTAPFTVTSTTQVANLSVATAGSATTAATVTTNAQPNITSVGTLTGLTVTSTITGNISGSASTAGSATVAGTVTTNAQPNITSTGTLTSLDVTGTVTAGGVTSTGGSVLIQNGGTNSGTLSVDGSGNANVFGTIIGNVVIGSGTSTAIMGNLVTANYFSGNGSLLTGVTATATPGGANTQLQFNNAGSMGGISTVTYDGIDLSLGAIANVKITGGTSGQVISTDGAGNLSFVTQSGGGGGTDFTPSFLLGGM